MIELKVLLDTCALIWAVSDAEKLSVSASELLEASDTEIFVSVISCAEVACLADGGRITLDRHWKTWFNQAVELNQWQTVEIGLEVIQEAYSLPTPFHRDPADLRSGR